MLRNLSDKLKQYAHGKLLWCLFALDLLFVAFILPRTQARLEAASGGMGPIDLQFFYTPAKVYTMIAAYGAPTRAFYRTFELTGDLLYPIIYTLFFSLLLTWLFRHSFAEQSRWQRLNVLPFGAWLFDLLENICIVTMLTLYPATPAPLAWLATGLTMVKWSFAGAALLLILCGLAMALRKEISGRTKPVRTLT